jgi:carbonic anhydrase
MCIRDVIVVVLLLTTVAKAGPPVGETNYQRVKRGEWAYSGLTGPSEWGTIKPEFALCGNGTVQSPIDISSATCDAISRYRTVRIPDVKLHESELHYEEEVRCSRRLDAVSPAISWCN